MASLSYYSLGRYVYVARLESVSTVFLLQSDLKSVGCSYLQETLDLEEEVTRQLSDNPQNDIHLNVCNRGARAVIDQEPSTPCTCRENSPWPLIYLLPRTSSHPTTRKAICRATSYVHRAHKRHNRFVDRSRGRYDVQSL